MGPDFALPARHGEGFPPERPRRFTAGQEEIRRWIIYASDKQACRANEILYRTLAGVRLRPRIARPHRAKPHKSRGNTAPGVLGVRIYGTLARKTYEPILCNPGALFTLPSACFARCRIGRTSRMHAAACRLAGRPALSGRSHHHREIGQARSRIATATASDVAKLAARRC